jgi:hypothetical protein
MPTTTMLAPNSAKRRQNSKENANSESAIDKEYDAMGRFEEIQIYGAFFVIILTFIWVISPVKENNKGDTQTLDEKK